jgi:hypothetical protein
MQRIAPHNSIVSFKPSVVPDAILASFIKDES